MPLTRSQIDMLSELAPGVQVIPWPKSMGWGAEQIGNIWDAYAKVATDAQPNDVIARVDSDVFFINRRIFDLIERSNYDLYGDGHFVNFEYTQGGCYFFNASAVNKIKQRIEQEGIDKLVKQADVAVEDVVAHALAKKENLQVKLTWFMGFPHEIENSGGVTSWFKFKFSCIHFVMKNKDKMLEVYIHEVLPEKERAMFKERVSID